MQKKNIDITRGTNIYNNKAKTTVIYYNKEELITKVFEDSSIDINKEFKGNIWINVDSVKDIEIINKIANLYNIDALIVEDIMNINQRVKLDILEGYIYLVLKMINYDKNSDLITHEQISFIQKDNVLITFQETNVDVFNSIRDNLIKLSNNHIGYLTYRIIDKIVDNYIYAIDELEDIIDELELDILENDLDNNDLIDVLDAKQDAKTIKKFISPIREIVLKIQSVELKEYFPESLKYYISDLKDHAIICHENIELINSRSSELIQLYHTITSNNMNVVMKTLAIISTIFMPLSFICGLYGMNFVNMPELRTKYGYFVVLAFMAILVAVMIYIFKKKKWF